ncbi:MAG: hypothetical protein GZ091_00565 [Paludibacter sp.]|nr:hypothetical protein [Paludibacter sp.]
MKKKSHISALLLIAILSFSCVSKSTALFVDNFENDTNPYGWSLVKDSGATGSFGFEKIGNNTVAKLNYDISNGGSWVGAQKSIQIVPKNAKGLRLQIKCSATSTAWIFLTDSTGRCFRHRLSRSLSDLDEMNWFNITLAFSTTPDSITGGVFTPTIQTGLKKITVAIEPRVSNMFGRDKWIPQPKGEMWFDNIEWITDFDETLHLITNEKDTISSTALWNKTGVCTHFEHGDLNKPDLITSLGFKCIRGDLAWGSVETKKGQFNYSYFDSIVKVAENNKLRTLFILCYGNKLYAKNTSDGLVSTEQITAFAHYCATTVRHFKGKDVDFEIWNEPNHPWFWLPKPDAIDFSKLLRVSIDSIKSANPKVTLISAGTAGIDWGFINTLGENKSLTGLDGIGVHPYVDGSPESISEDLICLRHLLKKYFKKVPKEWSTECGAISSKYGNGLSDSAQFCQARLDVRTILANWMVGFAYTYKYEFFCKGDSVDHQDNYGIIGFDMKPRPSYHAISTLQLLTENRLLLGRIKTQNTGAYALQFKGKNDNLLVLWTSAGKLVKDEAGYTTRFILPKKPICIYNYLGRKIPIPDKIKGQWILEAGGEVIYAVLPD